MLNSLFYDCLCYFLPFRLWTSPREGGGIDRNTYIATYSVKESNKLNINLKKEEAEEEEEGEEGEEEEGGEEEGEEEYIYFFVHFSTSSSGSVILYVECNSNHFMVVAVNRATNFLLT